MYGRCTVLGATLRGVEAIPVDVEVAVSNGLPAVSYTHLDVYKRQHEGNPDLVCGVCGEHGGDPDSIHTFNKIGLDYVSCSPYRVPVARLAAAQAALEEE